MCLPSYWWSLTSGIRCVHHPLVFTMLKYSRTNICTADTVVIVSDQKKGENFQNRPKPPKSSNKETNKTALFGLNAQINK